MNRQFDRPTPVAFQILLALAGGEKHGYAIMREIEERSVGEVRVGPGTLYRTIARMLEWRWIAETDRRPDPAEDDARRRYYRITDRGRQVALDEAERLDGLLKMARFALQLGEERS